MEKEKDCLVWFDSHCHLPYLTTNHGDEDSDEDSDEDDEEDDGDGSDGDGYEYRVCGGCIMGTEVKDWDEVEAKVNDIATFLKTQTNQDGDHDHGEEDDVAGEECHGTVLHACAPWMSLSPIVPIMTAQPTAVLLNEFVPFYGVHPWYAHKQPTTWEADLRARMEAHPRAGVGEIGLDFKAIALETGAVERDAQLEVWQTCMRVAAEYQRPVSMHCVKAFEPISSWLSKHTANPCRKSTPTKTATTTKRTDAVVLPSLPPAIVMHSYAGSAEFAKMLLALGAKKKVAMYFGVSTVINLRSVKRCRALIQAVPITSLLLESDVVRGDSACRFVHDTVDLIATVAGMTPKDAVSQLNNNAATMISHLHKCTPTP